MKAETELWQVQTHDGLYQADLPTLKQWVAEGAVLPTDRVRKGALNWIDAGRAPMLRRVFSGEEVVEVVEQPAHAGDVSAPRRQAESDLGLQGDEAAPSGSASDAASSPAGADAPHTPAGAEWAEPQSAGAPALGFACHF